MRTTLNHILLVVIVCLFNLPLFSQNDDVVVIDYMRTPKGLFETAFTNGELKERDKLFMETVELVKMEQTRMVDYGVKSQLASDNKASTKE